MLRDTLETRITRLLERACAENSELLSTGPKVLSLVELVEQRIDASIEKFVVEVQVRAAVRERPTLATTWPLYISAAKPDSEEDLALRSLWRIESGNTDAPSDKAAIVGALVTEALALIASIEHQVSEDRRRAAMAIDAGHPHHSFVSGMRDIPKDRMRHRGAPAQLPVERGYIQLLAPNCGSVQLHFPIEGLNETLLETLRTWRGSKGIRHWAALQRLLSVEGGRSGRVTWRLDEHFEALGYSERSCRDPRLRAEVAHEVELLTQMELAVYDVNGKLRLRQALLSPIAKGERLVEGSQIWALEGLSLEVHPLLYDGVRDPRTGQIGTHWFPQTTELAKVDDVRFPFVVALGLVLPIRWRWAWAEKRDHCALSGGSLLNAAGIRPHDRRGARAWLALRKTIAELQRISALDRVEWTSEPESINGICRLYPPAWAVDRTLHALPPIETPSIKLPTTGRELREWRMGKGWTQETLGEALDVSERTVKRAEAARDIALGPTVTKRLKTLASSSVVPSRGQIPADPGKL